MLLMLIQTMLQQCLDVAICLQLIKSDEFPRIFTPRRVCASGVKQLVLSVVHRPSVVCHKKFFITGDLESIMTSKRENNDKIRRILAYAYLVEHEAVLFSTFSTFLSVSSTILFITAMATPTAN